MEMAYNIGFSNFISYALLDWKTPNIQPMIFDILEKMDPSESEPTEIATDNEGRPLPIIMHKWLAGIIPSNALLKSVNDYLEHLDKKKYFRSNRQKNLIKRTFEVMFNPAMLANCTHPIMAGIQLLEECYNATNKDGTPKNTLLVLSNWDDVSFNLLKQRHSSIFNKYFESKHVVISGAIGLIKPRKEAFEYVIKTYDLDSKDCIFIDDQYDNILAAQAVGITALLLCKNNYKALRQILIKINAL